MAVPRRRRLVSRLVGSAVDVVGDRVPWLSEQAYRVVAAPLQWADPVGGARMAEARLDDVRDRVSATARSGRLTHVQRRRVERDLARTREDLERTAARLPAVQARGLARRLDAYGGALARLPGGPLDPGRPATVRDAVVVAGAAAATSTALLLPAVGAVAEGGLLAGAAAALGLTAVQRRRARKERIAAVVGALVEADQATRTADGVDLRVMDAGRRELVRRALASQRLDERGALSLRGVDTHLDALLVRLVDGDLEADASYVVQATITRYLPDTLEPFLSLTDPHAVVGGRPAAAEVAEQLAAIERGLAEVARRPARGQPENLLLLQGEFLRSKFGDPSHDGAVGDHRA